MFEVTASDPAAMTVEVAIGGALVGGLWCQLETAQILDVAANATGSTRYDLVFLHWTRTNQTVQLRIVDGTAATCAAAVAPAANAIGTYQTAGPPVSQWAVPLACIEVPNGATSIVAGNITDLREFSRFRTAAGDAADGTSITTEIVAGLTPAMTDTGAVFAIAANGVGIDEIAAAIAGDGLTGGAGSALDVVPDGSSLELNADQLRIAAGAAGNGLTGGGGVALAVNPDGVTTEIAADQLRVVADSIDHTHLPTRERPLWIGAEEMQQESAGGPTWGVIGAFPVCAEGWVFATGVNAYVIAHVHVPANWVGANQIYFTYVWAHIYFAGGTFSVRWQAQHVSYVLCSESLTSGVGNTYALASGRVNNTTTALRLCDTGGNLATSSTTFDDGYIDVKLGRNGADPSDDYGSDVLLLGAWVNFDEDM